MYSMYTKYLNELTAPIYNHCHFHIGDQDNENASRIFFKLCLNTTYFPIFSLKTKLRFLCYLSIECIFKEVFCELNIFSPFFTGFNDSTITCCNLSSTTLKLRYVMIRKFSFSRIHTISKVIHCITECRIYDLPIFKLFQ